MDRSIPPRQLPRQKAADNPPKPDFVDMVDPTLVEMPPTGERWAHGIKWDGCRIQAHVDSGQPTLYTRKGLDWTMPSKPIAAALAKLPARTAILDGEVVALGADCRPDFHAARSQVSRLVHKVFDLLWFDDEDLRPLPFHERKKRLHSLLERSGPGKAIEYVESLETDGPKVYAGACELGLEGIVSKRLDSPYRAGRSDHWLKCRCAVVETVAVVGFTGGMRINGLHVARAEEGELAYAGRIERGLDAAVRQLEAMLRLVAIDQSPLMKRARGYAVKPGVLVEISHRGITAGGVMRHPRFVRLRSDLDSGSARGKRR